MLTTVACVCLTGNVTVTCVSHMPGESSSVMLYSQYRQVQMADMAIRV